MLTLAHAGRAPVPGDLWGAWHLDPALVAVLLLAAWTYRRGLAGGARPHVATWRTASFACALGALAVALVSPLEALSTALASAHMVQHVLLLLVVAPLLALSAPLPVLLRGSPPIVRRACARWRGRTAVIRSSARLHDPVTVWLLHVGTVWFWHAAGPYDAALANDVVHILEHVTFVVTALLFWRVAIATGRSLNGAGILMVFTMAVQSVLLAALLVFAPEPWYSGYRATTTAWGLEPLTDQQLAGLIMWIPAGLVHVCAGLALLTVWLRGTERDAPAPATASPVADRPGGTGSSVRHL